MIEDLTYEVQLFLCHSQPENFWGTIKIGFNLPSIPLTESLKLGSKVTTRSATLNGKPLEIVEATANTILLPADHLVLGHNQVEVNYIGDYSVEGTLATGLYREDRDGRLYCAYTQCEPDFAKQIFPVFEKFEYKGRYTTTVIIPAELEMITNEFIDSEKTIETQDNLQGVVSNYLIEKYNIMTSEEEPQPLYKVIKSKQTPPISFNLFGMAVGKWVKFSQGEHKGRPINIYCLEEKKNLLAKCVTRLTNLTFHGLKFFEDYFGHDMLFSKYEQIFLPNFSFNGMENPGCIFLKDKNIEEPTSIWEVFNRDRLIMHEMAHMWMGNLVTMDDFYNIWLKEAVVEYLCHKCLETIIPQVNPLITPEDVLVNFVHRTSLVMRSENPPFAKDSYPLCFRCEPYHDDIKEYYSLIVYQKGSSFMRGLDLLLGQDIFRDSIRRVIQRYKLKTYNEEDFKNIICEIITESSHDAQHTHSAEERKGKFLRWFQDHVHEKGYSVIKVDNFVYDNAEKAVKITIQAKYSKYYDIKFRAYGFQGQLLREFSFNPKPSISENPEEHVFIQHEIAEPVAVIIPNVSYGSFMVVELDPVSLAHLFDKLHPLIHHLSTLERAVVYQSFIRKPRPELKTQVFAASILDSSIYVNELYGIKNKSWMSLAWFDNMQKQLEMK